MENVIIYDALSFTSKIHDLRGIIELLGIEGVHWETVYGSKGFKSRQYFEGVSIHFARDDGLIWVEMSGQGCRTFESFGTGDYEYIFEEIQLNEGDMKLTRLDVAFDDHSGVLDLDTLVCDTLAGFYNTRFKAWEVCLGSQGTTIYHGSKKSELILRIYDKAMERGYSDGRHWVRVELQLRRDRAMRFVQSDGSIGERFRGVLVNYVKYVEPSNDSNKWRWSLAAYWSNLIENAAAIQLYEKVGVEYNLFNLTNFVFKQAGNAIDACIAILGEKLFFEELRERKTMQNPKYKKLVEESMRLKGVNDADS